MLKSFCMNQKDDNKKYAGNSNYALIPQIYDVKKHLCKK